MGRPVWKRINVVGPRAVNGLNVVGYGRSGPEQSWTVPSLIEKNKRKARKSVDTMRNNLDGDVTKSYRINTLFMFECVLHWFALGSSLFSN